MNTDGTRNKLLIVDDVRANLLLLHGLLADQYEICIALNGQRALQLAILEPQPDIILLDILMPGMDGYEICQHLKADKKTVDIPVIFISAMDEIFNKVKAFRIGALDYITKPFCGREVLARVENQLLIRNQKALLEQQNMALEREIQETIEAERALRKAQRKSQLLLLNVMPKCIAEQLTKKGKVDAKQYREGTFLFANMVAFSTHSTILPPKTAVALVNRLISAFDQRVEQYGLEKIRNIGGSYFVAGGLPLVRDDHAEAMACLALEMQNIVSTFRWSQSEPIRLRIGFHSGGPVVASVIGLTTFAYDVWGDAVNMASRMQSHGAANRIHVSYAVYERLQNKFQFEKRGKTRLKGGREMETYWLLKK